MTTKNNQTSSHQINIHGKRSVQSFVMHEISEDEVRTSLNNVKAHTAHGFDNIPAKFIKTAAYVLTPFLTRIFNKCLGGPGLKGPGRFQVSALSFGIAP